MSKSITITGRAERSNTLGMEGRTFLCVVDDDWQAAGFFVTKELAEELDGAELTITISRKEEDDGTKAS